MNRSLLLKEKRTKSYLKSPLFWLETKWAKLLIVFLIVIIVIAVDSCFIDLFICQYVDFSIYFHVDCARLWIVASTLGNYSVVSACVVCLSPICTDFCEIGSEVIREPSNDVYWFGEKKGKKVFTIKHCNLNKILFYINNSHISIYHIQTKLMLLLSGGILSYWWDGLNLTQQLWLTCNLTTTKCILDHRIIIFWNHKFPAILGKARQNPHFLKSHVSGFYFVLF